MGCERTYETSPYRELTSRGIRMEAPLCELDRGMQGQQLCKKQVMWAKPLHPGTSAQQAELIALTRALTLLGKDKTPNMYTDARYAFATAHIHGPANGRGKDCQKQR